MSRRPTWKTLIERFDPETPVQNSAWRAARSRSPAQVICERLDVPVGIPRVLVTGTVGTGKTTELYRIAEERTAKEFVVFVDLERHFSEVVGDAPSLEGISAWEVCFLMGVALLRAAEEQLHFKLPKTHSEDLQKAWSALAQVTSSGDSPSFDIASLARSMIVLASSALPGAAAPVNVGLKLLQEASGSVKWSIPIGRALGLSGHPLTIAIAVTATDGMLGAEYMQKHAAASRSSALYGVNVLEEPNAGNDLHRLTKRAEDTAKLEPNSRPA